MKILAENRFTLTKPLFMEGMLRISKDSYGKSAKKAVLFFLAVWVVVAIGLMYTAGTVLQIIVLLFVILGFSLWLNIAPPRKHAKKSWEALVNRSGEDPERVIRFFENHLEADAGGSIKSVPYGEILWIRQSKNLLLLTCEDKITVMVAKDGFTSGSIQQITTLIRSAADQES